MMETEMEQHEIERIQTSLEPTDDITDMAVVSNVSPA